MRQTDDTGDESEGGADSAISGADLTVRQRKVLEVIRSSVSERGYPPSIREIGDAVGLTSTSSVAHQLRALERKGFLRRDPNRPRAVDVRGLDEVGRAVTSLHIAPVDETDGATADSGRPTPTFVPVGGRVGAGGAEQGPQGGGGVLPRPREMVGGGWGFSAVVFISWPSRRWRTCSRCPANWSARVRCSC